MISRSAGTIKRTKTFILACEVLDFAIRPAYISLISEITNYENDMNDAFQALSDPTRREILRMLREREMTAGEIAERFPLAKSTLSGHFNVLKHAGLVVAEKTGTTIVYSLNLSIVEETVATMMEIFDFGVTKLPARRPRHI